MTGPTKLLNRNFFLLWQGNFVSQLGSQAFAIAIIFWIKHETGSASLMGFLLMVSLLPSVILGPIAGTFADQFSRRKIIIVSDVISGVAVIFLAVLILVGPDRNDLLLTAIFVVNLLLGCVRTFFGPAVSAAIPDLVPEEQINAANSLKQSTEQISLFVGQGLGGYLFTLLGAPVLFLIDGISYLFSALSESFIRIPQTLPETATSWKQKIRTFKADTVAGFRFVWNQNGLRAVFFAAAFLNFFMTPFGLLLPFYVEDFLQVTAAWYGYLLAAVGLGSLIGFGAAGTLRIAGSKRTVSVILSLILASGSIAAISFVRNPTVALALMLTLGALSGFININIYSILQLTTESEMRGRVFGFLTTLTAGLMPISMALSGIIADQVGQNVPLIYLISGVICVTLSILTALSREFRKFLAFVPTTDTSESLQELEANAARV
jgi:MFS family permease